jgi:LAO/AO transport system kinase
LNSSRPQLSIEDHVQGVLSGELSVFSRTITLIESNAPRHRKKAQEVLTRLLPKTGASIRVGITGVPGVGKSTFIESLGVRLLEAGHRVAVLAVDPTSSVRGGSILGDKTRMSRLASDPRAYIRPSPSQGSLGGVHRKTRETLLLCEAAGYDVVLVETVGVGQSETVVAEMVDTFLVLMLAGAGDDLQGIKKGILELADVIAINKADGDNKISAARARGELEGALHIMRPANDHWQAPVVTCSAIEDKGIGELWETVLKHRSTLESVGFLAKKRTQQKLRWTWSLVEQGLLARLKADSKVAELSPEIERAVLDGHLPATVAAEKLLEAFWQKKDRS